MTADISGAVARYIWTGGDVADAEVAAVMGQLRAMSPSTIIDEVDVRVIRDALDAYRDARHPAVGSDHA